MKKTKENHHTPGPWYYKQDGFRITMGDASTRHKYLEHDRTVAVIEDNSFQAEANARLIAAAPDLLGAAKHLIEHLTKIENGKWLNNAAGQELKIAIDMAENQR